MSEYREGAEVAGRFVILDKLGEGGMGTVFRALQTSLDREVALKVLHSQVAFTPRARRRFGREARAVARLNHPHIAAVYDFGADDGDQSLWLAMELVVGTAMTGLKRADLDILRLMSLTDQVLSALSAAHARGIIHRDMKPSNILLTHDDAGREVIKLVDFGLAATQDGDLSLENAPGGLDEEENEQNSRVIMGTPRYMAPEIFRRKPVDPRVDLYALGVILFEILSGKPPFPGDDPRLVMRGHLKEPIPRLVPREGIEVPAELERVIYKLLAKEADERYQTAIEVREGLQAILGSYSFVPWAQGPAMADLNASSFGNMTHGGFLSRFGGQTIPPAAMFGGSRPGINSSTAPLVGRAIERRTIEHHVRRCAQENIAAIVTIEGESGIGKTRLAQWIQVRIDESGIMRCATGYHTRNGGGFDGMRAVLDTLLGTSEAPYDDMPRIIESRLKRWDFAADEIETCIQLMRPGGESALFDASGPVTDRVSRQERVFAVIERILRKVSRERPLMILLENLHVAGETTFAFLEHLAVGLHLNPDPVLIVMTVNSEMFDTVPEMRDSLTRLGRFGIELARIKLGRLDTADATQLVQKILPIDDAMASRIAQRSGGNALHLTQIVRYLQESEKIKFENGAWQLQPGVDIDSEVPEELVELMRYRAERVASRYPDGEALTQILERCALLGQRFDYRLLRRFLAKIGDKHIEAHVDAALEYLVREGIFREVGHTGEDVLEFNHAVMRDVLVNDMEGRRTQRQIHKLAAEAKVSFYGNRVNQHGLEIAEHYRRARDARGVYVFTVKAARAAMAGSDLDTAIRLYRDAMSLAEKDETIDADLEEGLQEVSSVMRSEEVSLEVANIELKIGEYVAAREHYRTLLRSANREIAVWARWGLGQLALKQGELDEAIGWFDAALRETQSLEQKGFTQTSQRVEAHSLFGLGTVSYLKGDLKSAAVTLPKALENAQKQQERLLEGDILRTLSDVMWSLGDTERSEIYRRRATMLAEGDGDQDALAQSMLHAATFLRQVGQPGRAEEQTRAAMAIFESVGKRHATASSLLVLGHIAWCRGEFKEAAAHYREAHRLFEAFEDRRGMTHCKLRLSELAFSIRKYRESQTLIRDASEGYRAMGDRIGLAYCRLLHGRIELAANNLDAAVGVFATCVAEFEEIGDVAGRVQAQALEAATMERLGRHEEVENQLREIFAAVKGLPVAYENFAAALDMLSADLNQRRPELAIETDGLAEEAWTMLGRPVRAIA
ncbi:MAG: protein kinase [bacterium]